MQEELIHFIITREDTYILVIGLLGTLLTISLLFNFINYWYFR